MAGLDSAIIAATALDYPHNAYRFATLEFQHIRRRRSRQQEKGTRHKHAHGKSFEPRPKTSFAEGGNGQVSPRHIGMTSNWLRALFRRPILVLGTLSTVSVLSFSISHKKKFVCRLPESADLRRRLAQPNNVLKTFFAATDIVTISKTAQYQEINFTYSLMGVNLPCMLQQFTSNAPIPATVVAPTAKYTVTSSLGSLDIEFIVTDSSVTESLSLTIPNLFVYPVRSLIWAQHEKGLLDVTDMDGPK